MCWACILEILANPVETALALWQLWAQVWLAYLQPLQCFSIMPVHELSRLAKGIKLTRSIFCVRRCQELCRGR